MSVDKYEEACSHMGKIIIEDYEELIWKRKAEKLMFFQDSKFLRH